VRGVGSFVAGADKSGDAGKRFFTGLDIEILHSICSGMAPHHRSPTSAMKPAGQDLETRRSPALETAVTTALSAAERQPFLDNLVADIGVERSSDYRCWLKTDREFESLMVRQSFGDQPTVRFLRPMGLKKLRTWAVFSLRIFSDRSESR